MSIGNEPPQPPSSPVFKFPANEVKHPQMYRNGIQEEKVIKINRIPLVRTAVVHVLRAESPSCVWVRLTNHITEQLILTEPCELNPRCGEGMVVDLYTDVLREYEYCMAPLEDRKYGRCRVLECLACMPRNFMYHPWQAIMVSLCGVNKRKLPKNKNQDSRMWSAAECTSFRQLLSRFPLVKTRTVKSSIVYNDYRRPVQVEIYGIPDGHTDTSPDVGISVAALFTAELRGRMRLRRIANAALFAPDDNFIEIAQPPPLSDIPPFRRTFPSNWRRDSASADQLSQSSELANEWRRWSPHIARVPPLEIKWLNDHGYRTTEDEYLINIEGPQTQSPYEFYARPIKRERVRVTQAENGVSDEFMERDELQCETLAMLSANEDLKVKATILDTFYSLEENRSPLEKNQCIEWLRDNIRVFAIRACSEERGAYTGEWQRVEVLSCDVTANVLYLDSGGTELVLPQTLYKIHPTHCNYPPMCMQLCMYGVGPNSADGSTDWTEGAKKAWRKLLREDLPMVISVIGRLNASDDDKTLPTGAPAWQRPGVIFVQSLRVHGESIPTLQKFCDASLYPNNGIQMDEMPRTWDYD